MSTPPRQQAEHQMATQLSYRPVGWGSQEASSDATLTLIRKLDSHGREYFVQASPPTRFMRTAENSGLNRHHSISTDIVHPAASQLLYNSLRVRVDPEVEVRLDDSYRTLVAPENRFITLTPDQEFDTSFVMHGTRSLFTNSTL